VNFPRLAVFLQNVLQLYQQRWVILHVDSLTLWKVINVEDAVLIPKNRGEKFPVDFCTWNFLGWGEPLCRYSIDCCFVSGSKWYNQVLSMVTNCDKKSFGLCRKKSKSCSDDWHHWHFRFAFRHFRPPFAESFRMSKSSWMMGPTCSREMPSCSAIDLAKIRWSSKISLSIWSIISGVVTVLDCPGRGTSQVEKTPCLNWAIQFLTVAYYGACSPNVSVRMAWICFGALPCRKRNLMTACISMLLKLHALPDMLPFSLCNRKRLAIRHMNRPLFPTTLSILSYDIGK